MSKKLLLPVNNPQCATMTTKFTRRRSDSTRESLTMIPELPSIEDHYNEDSSEMVLTPRTRNTATVSRSAIQRQQRRAIVLQAIDNAIKILQIDGSQELDLDDSTNTSCTAPLTDEEPSNSAHSSNSFVSPEATPDSPLLRGNRRWTASAQQSPITPASNTKKKRRGNG